MKTCYALCAYNMVRHLLYPKFLCKPFICKFIKLHYLSFYERSTRVKMQLFELEHSILNFLCKNIFVLGVLNVSEVDISTVNSTKVSIIRCMAAVLYHFGVQRFICKWMTWAYLINQLMKTKITSCRKLQFVHFTSADAINQWHHDDSITVLLVQSASGWCVTTQLVGV